MIEEAFVNGDSIIHRLDPRVKTVIAFLFSIVVATSDRFVALIPAIFLSVSFIFLARLPLKKVCLRLLLVNGLILFLWFFLPFTYQGRPLFSIGPLVATREGISHSTMITIKSNAIILALMSLVATMSIFSLGRAMRNLHVPARIVYLFFFTYRYIHVIHMEYMRLIKAIKIRGFRPSTNMHTYRTYAYLVGMLLVKSHDRAERVQSAMLCRGFKGKFYELSEFSFKFSDLIIMLLMLSAVTIIVLLQWY